MPLTGTASPLSALIAGAVLIGFSPIFVRLSELGPVATAFYRLGLALPLLLLLQRLSPRTAQRPAGGDATWFLLAGIAFALDIIAWHWSITLTTVANATLFANFAPVFVVAGGWLAWRESPGGTYLLALPLGLAGAAILAGENLRIDASRFTGDLLGLLTAVFYAAYILAVARLRRRHGFLRILMISTAISAMLVLPVAWLTEPRLVVDSLYGLAVLLGLSWISHAGGQGLITWALAHLSAAFSSLTLLVQPVVAALAAWWLFGESLNPAQLGGAGLVLLAILLASRSRRPDGSG